MFNKRAYSRFTVKLSETPSMISVTQGSNMQRSEKTVVLNKSKLQPESRNRVGNVGSYQVNKADG